MLREWRGTFRERDLQRAQAALQVAPRIPPSYRPFVLGPLKAVPPPGLTSGPESWYRDTSYGPPRAPTYKALNGGVVPIAAGSAAGPILHHSSRAAAKSAWPPLAVVQGTIFARALRRSSMAL